MGFNRKEFFGQFAELIQRGKTHLTLELLDSLSLWLQSHRFGSSISHYPSMIRTGFDDPYVPFMLCSSKTMTLMMIQAHLLQYNWKFVQLRSAQMPVIWIYTVYKLGKMHQQLHTFENVLKVCINSPHEKQNKTKSPKPIRNKDRKKLQVGFRETWKNCDKDTSPFFFDRCFATGMESHKFFDGASGLSQIFRALTFFSTEMLFFTQPTTEALKSSRFIVL